LVPAVLLAVGFVAVLGALVVTGTVPLVVLVAYVGMSAVTLLAYRSDKSAARQGRRRTPESTLHLLSLLGGWPGGLVARHAFRHKTTKQPFRSAFWVTVVANCLALTAVVWAGALQG
jgi:uncharacterized membrane protein YsdA (DUF1294 family)